MKSNRTRALIVLIPVVIILAVIALITKLTSHSSPPSPFSGMSTSTGNPLSLATQSPPPAPSPTPTLTKQTTVYVYTLTGTAPATIQYGDMSNEINVPGTPLPWTGTGEAPQEGNQIAIYAVMHGNGPDTATISERITTTCSNGTSKTETFQLQSDTESGDGNSVAPQYDIGFSDPNDGTAEQDAGC